ncbi:pi31 proteasome regulator [Grosmannia clavigera kw1407]|uniref:Pi31 proteasome regulator n=1 Tax=Grosmannia clavigera (strain kw1407 / UAMH 11150) TaxID=655863 RepID=F0X8H4_GROCL|nr:pi31 proteasome regulator [Grosmannia clavigera kw1407]EFX05489.1 pi31 proteasome regulator [Grosmannia clavigera kw1407]
MAPGGPLSPDALLQAMVAALPSSRSASHTSDPDSTDAATTTTSNGPDLSSPYEALALFAHACMTQLGFRLVGFEEDRVETFPDAPRLLARWNRQPTSLSFVYAHAQSALTFVVRVDRMGAKVEIRGLATGAERIQRIELVVQDHIATSELPWTRESSNSSNDTDTERLARLFFSRDRMAQLAARFQTDIVQKLVPGLHKDGYEETADDREAREDAEQTGHRAGGPVPALGQPRQPPINPYQPNPLLDPLAAPRRPAVPAGDFAPPGFEDEYEIQRPPRGSGGLTAGGIQPPSIGQDDLHPPGLGPHDPLRPFLGGLGRGGGGLRQPGVGGFGGMHPTFDDPLFGGQRGGDGDGDGFDLQIPPGARYDDPTGGVGGLGPRFGGGRRSGGRGYNPYGGGGFGGGFGDII